MIINNPFTLSSSKYRRQNIREIYLYTRFCTEIYIRDRIAHNIKTGNIYYYSDFYIPQFYRERWHSYSIKWRQKKDKKKIKYEDNMERINFGTFICPGISLREAIVFNKKTGVVSFTSYFEIR